MTRCLLFVALLFSCSSDPETTDAGAGQQDATSSDALQLDAGRRSDANMGPADATQFDSGTDPDSGMPDIGTPDSGTDSGTPDASTPDLGTPDSSTDSGTPDLGRPDSGTDSGTPDLGTPDLGTPDVGTPDAGMVFLQRNGTQLSLGGQPFQAIAMNKFDLFYQFLGIASGSNATVTRPQALQAMDDAVTAGVCCFRIAATPFWPVNAQTWVNDPQAHWAAFDDMLAELRARDLKIIPTVWWHIWLFADMANEPLHETFNPSSASHALLFAYAQELVSRYGGDDTILFWDLTNEINLEADLDFGQRTDASIATHMGTPAARSSADNFTTDEMVTLLVELATFIKATDPNHLISTGYAYPRPAAWHLRAQPEWSPQGADWTIDSATEMNQYVAFTHPAPIDLVGIHLYPAQDRFGLSGRDPDLLGFYQAAADAINKPLFVGEFGDSNPTVSEARSASFTRRDMIKMLELRIPLSLIWIWEFYQFAPNAPSPHSIEPGVDDELIAIYSELNTWLQSASTNRGFSIPVTNSFMEADTNNNQLVDGWETTWRNGASTGYSAGRYQNPTDVFEGTATLRLNSGTGDASSYAYALSDPIAVGGGEDLLMSAAIRQNLSGNMRVQFTMAEHDAGGTEIRATGLVLDQSGGWTFKIEHYRQTLLMATRTVRIRFGAGGEETTIIDVDDVRISQVEP